MIQLHSEIKRNCILIPFYSRLDLLESLLSSLSSYNVLVVDGSNGLLDSSKQPKHVFVLKNKGKSSFAHSVNLGLEYLEKQEISQALLLNDDAEISSSDCQILFAEWSEKQLLSPKIIQAGEDIYGIKVKAWGRVSLLKEKQKPDALLGTCLLIPTELRFDVGFPHGFEDIELSLRVKKHGYSLRVFDSVVCRHLGEASLSRKQRTGQRYSTYGHLRLYSSKRKAPIICILSLLQIVKERGGYERYLGWVQGVGDWSFKDCLSFAARMAPSSSGSSKAR